MLYVNQIGDTQNPPPYTFPNVMINSFRLAVSLDALTALCDDLLNIGDANDRGFEFRPLFPFVDLEVLSYPRMEYALFPWAGYVSQLECCVRIFVMKYISCHGWVWPDGEVAVFCPFVIVNNPWSAFAGRDVLGYPKLFGEFTKFSSTDPSMMIKTEVFRELFEAEKSTYEPIVAIAKAPKGAKEINPPNRKWPWGQIDDDLLDAVERVLGKSFVFTPDFFEAVQMKQFRDATLPFNACYQAILQSLMFIEFSGDFAKLPPARVTLNDYATFDLAKRLGLPSGEPLTPISQFNFKCSFSLGEVITLFTNGSKSFWCL